MAFKMRSGNKVSFKSMGSSPVKQSTDNTNSLDDDGLDNSAVELQKERNANKRIQDQLDALKAADNNSEDKRQERKLTGKMTAKDRANQEIDRAQRTKDKENAPWSQKTKDLYADKDKRDGYRTDTEGNTVYVESQDDTTPSERRANNRANKEKSNLELDKWKTNNPKPNRKSANYKPGDMKAWRNEKNLLKKGLRYDDKTKKMDAKYRDHQASGKQGLKFNWKNLLAGGVEGAFDVTPSRDIMSEKILKRDANTRNKKAVSNTKAKTRQDKEDRTGKKDLRKKVTNLFRRRENKK